MREERRGGKIRHEKRRSREDKKAKRRQEKKDEERKKIKRGEEKTRDKIKKKKRQQNEFRMQRKTCPVARTCNCNQARPDERKL